MPPPSSLDRRWAAALLLALAAPLFAAPTAAAADATRRACRETCRSERRVCTADVRAVRAAALTACEGARSERRACRRAARRAARAGRGACRRGDREVCRPCCAAGGDDCHLPTSTSTTVSTTSTTSSSLVTTSTVSTTTTLPLPLGPEPVFESGLVRPLALSPDGSRVFAVNAPDGRLEILEPAGPGLVHVASVPVGLEPVAVAVRTPTEVWVVNHLSDSVSIVDVGSAPPRVMRTLLVGDEPRDLVFAGPDRRRAFVTTAHRGQHAPFDPAFEATGVGRADVWVFDATDLGAPLGGTPLTILTLFGDTPRALATSPDGTAVYAAVFLSGNRTGTVPAAAVCDGGATAAPCVVEGIEMPGGLPAPNANLDGVPQPEVGLIARHDPASGAWLGPGGTDWRAAMRFTLPDLDVFAIDATATPPVEIGVFAGVGTVLYAMATHPETGRVFVANTEARNDVRFEGFGGSAAGTVRGRLHETRVTVLDPATGAVTPRPLNPHIDYALVPSPPGVGERSIALPVAAAFAEDGAALYVAGLGSDAIAVVDPAALEAGTHEPSLDDRIPLAGGPAGLLVDAGRDRLYVLTRFDLSVVTVDLGTRAVVDRLPLFDPEPAPVRAGRRLLYDAARTSSNGEAACASCHVFGDVDGLAWDLGDPDGVVLENPLRLRNAGPEDDPSFHPLKGPMATQTLRGMATHGSMHWRGDRTGGHDPGGDPEDERAAFARFRVAFDTLLGLGDVPTLAEMDGLTDFALSLTLPPNPVRRLDGALTASQAAGEAFFLGDGGCVECHIVDPAHGFFGTDGAAAFASDRPQFMKIPHLRTLYTKVGRGFGTFALPPNRGDVTPMGDQIRGFGFTHDGAAGTVQVPAFPFLMAFPTDLAPVVGQQATLSGTDDGTIVARVTLLDARAAAGDADLVAHGVLAGAARGWLRLPDGTWTSDRAAEPTRSLADLLGLASDASPVTWTAVPPGTGARRSIDRDADGHRDGDERDAGSNPDDPASVPAPA